MEEQSTKKPLSPVLNKRKFNRKLIFEKKINRKTTHENAFMECRKLENEAKNFGNHSTEQRSFIPVLTKDKFVFKEPNIPKKIIRTSEATGKRLGFQTASGKLLSISESKLHKYADFFTDLINEKTESDLMVKKGGDGNRKCNLVTRREDIKKAYGDNRDIGFVNDSMDMLYQNNEFESGESKTTTPMDDIKGNESNEIFKSQLNYESCSTLKHQIENMERIEKSILSKNIVNVDYTPSIFTEEFSGFNQKEIEEIEEQFRHFRTSINQIKKQNEILQNSQNFRERKVMGERNGNKMKNGREKSSQPNTISLASKNMVQISVDNNRVKISIKSAGEFKTEMNSQKNETKIKNKIDISDVKTGFILGNETNLPNLQANKKEDFIFPTTTEQSKNKKKIEERKENPTLGNGINLPSLQAMKKEDSVFPTSTAECKNKKKIEERKENLIGFQFVSGQKVETLEKQLKLAKKIFRDDLELSSNDILKFNCGLGKEIEIPEKEETNLAHEVIKKELDSTFISEQELESIEDQTISALEEKEALNGLKFSLGQKIDISDDMILEEEGETEDFQFPSGQNVENTKEKIKFPEKFEVQNSFDLQFVPDEKLDISEDKIKLEEKILGGEGLMAQKRPEIFEFGSDQNFEVPEGEKNSPGFQLDSGKKAEIPKGQIRISKKLYAQVEMDTNEPSGFQFVSGKKLKISEDDLKAAQKIFAEENLQKFVSDQITIVNEQPKFKSERKILKARTSLHSRQEKCQLNIKHQDESNIIIPSEDLEKDARFLNDGNSQNESPEKSEDQKTACQILEDVVKNYDNVLERLDKRSTSIPVAKKRLGGKIKFQPISIPQTNLKKAKEIFKDFESPLKNCFPNSEHLNCTTILSSSMSNRLPCTPLKDFPRNAGNCTPTHPRISVLNEKINDEDLTPLKAFPTDRNFTSTPIGNGASPNVPCEISPLKLKSTTSDSNLKTNSSIIFLQRSHSDINVTQTNLQRECEHLQKKLKVLEKRKMALKHQKDCIDGIDKSKKIKLGVLSLNKTNCKERVPLEKLNNFADDNIQYFNVAQQIIDLTPKMATELHFNLGSNNEKAIITTLDGAVVIPNISNVIGLTEIGNAFQAMEGVDAKLLPKYWIENHFKWIVWKLACYERKFPQYFKDILSVENVIQQLKYRYDVEIDGVKRSALKRIMEKDDIPQKRLVLCVSDLISIYNNKYDLELTDGWYSIRTVIDSPLNQQIIENKIKVGTKLMIQGAELLNCEGCSPLEAPSNIRLKIGFNSTRRALWHVKLGYYKFPMPFFIPLRSVSPEGGQVSAIKIYIARVYPIRYMETQNNIKVWRNEKAEEKRAQEFDIEKTKIIENLKHKLLKDYETVKKKIPKTHVDTCTDIKNIDCPQTLEILFQNSKDPEHFFNQLSTLQKDELMKYKQKKLFDQDEQISREISKQIQNVNMNKRNVISLLKLLVLDVDYNSGNHYVLNIWKPNEEQLNIMKEESTLIAYNVNIKKPGEFSSSTKTVFKKVTTSYIDKKMLRHLLPIAMTIDIFYKPLFNEFDTVGLIIEVQSSCYDQNIWLSDFIGRLLYVRVNEGSSKCCIMENVEKGKCVALSNLVMQKPLDGFGCALGNQYTVISQYPQQKFLQNGLKIFMQQLPKDISKLINECEKKISNIRNTRNKNEFVLENSQIFGGFEDSFESSSTIPSKLSLTDVQMSLIDTDQFI